MQLQARARGFREWPPESMWAMGMPKGVAAAAPGGLAADGHGAR